MYTITATFITMYFKRVATFKPTNLPELIRTLREIRGSKSLTYPMMFNDHHNKPKKLKHDYDLKKLIEQLEA